MQDRLRILALSGGGANGAFQVGVLKRLYRDTELPYDAIFGVSTGALTASVLAQGSDVSEQRICLSAVERIYLSLRGNADIYKTPSLGIIGKAAALLRKGGLYDPSPLRKLIEKHVDPPTLFRSDTVLRVGYVNLETGKYELGGGGDKDIQKKVLWSASQPGLFQLNSPHCDGGVRNITPLGDVFEWVKRDSFAAEYPSTDIDIDVILCGPVNADLEWREINYKNPLAVLSRTFEVLLHEAFLSDIRRVLKKNRKPDFDDFKVNLRVFAPPYNLGPSLTFDPERIAQTIRLGEETADAAVSS